MGNEGMRSVVSNNLSGSQRKSGFRGMKTENEIGKHSGPLGSSEAKNVNMNNRICSFCHLNDLHREVDFQRLFEVQEFSVIVFTR